MCASGITNSALAQDVNRQVSRVTFDIYRFQNNFHVNMFVITGDGVVVTDPINEEDRELSRETRFTLSRPRCFRGA